MFDRYAVNVLCCLHDPTELQTHILYNCSRHLKIDGMCHYILGCVIMIDRAASAVHIGTCLNEEICVHLHTVCWIILYEAGFCFSPFCALSGQQCCKMSKRRLTEVPI